MNLVVRVNLLRGPAYPRVPLKGLLTGGLLLVWCVALSGIALPLAPDSMLILHLASSIAGFGPVLVYLARHWWVRRSAVSSHPNTPLGYVTLACLSVLALTGLLLLRWTNVPALRWLHDGATATLLLALTFHFAWRAWVGGLALRYIRSSTVVHWLVCGVLVTSAAGMVVWLSQPELAASPSREIAVQHASLENRTLASASDCATCHSDITEQWRISAHARGAMNAYYQAVAGIFIQEYGVEAARYCAVCHNPVGLMQGEIDSHAAKPTGLSSGLAYQARRLNISLPISQRAAEGVTCAMCHQAAHVSEQPTNGSLRLDPRPVILPANALGQLSLRTAPAFHKQSLLPSAIQQAELCGSCHNLHLPDGQAVEATFDEWLASPYPAQGKTCQSCHLARAQARRADSGWPQSVGAHGGSPGAPSSLPDVTDGPGLLQQAATLQVSLTVSPDSDRDLIVTVTITNSGTGHHLPTGASDLRQVWLEVTLRDATGDVLWQSGQMDEHGNLPPDAVQFHKVLGDARGQPIDLHRIWMTAQVLSDTSLAPMETRRIPYHIALAPSASSPYILTVRLLYQDVSQAFAEFALDRAISAGSIPTREMARAEIVLSR